MASDSQDSHRKHSRSPSDDESPETSKRHKHRHRRHRHRRHRHHKKHDDVKKDEIEPDSKNGVYEGGVPVVVADYDMEEGEIVEDVVIGGGMKVDSDVESGEVRDFDYLVMKGDAGMVCPEANYSLPVVDNGANSNLFGGKSPLLESSGNGDCELTSNKIESASYTRHTSPRRSSKHKSDHGNKNKKHSLDSLEMDDDGNVRHRNKLRENKHQALSRSPSNGRHYMETSDRSRSVSPVRTREREPSRRRHRHERDEHVYANDMVPDGLDDERDSRKSTDLRLESRDMAKCRRERSSRLHRSTAVGSKDEHSDFRDIEREEKLYYDKKRAKEKLRSRERSERDSDSILEKERNGSGGRDHGRDYESDRDRGILRDLKSDMDRYTGRDRESIRDRDCDWNRGRDLDGDKQRDTTINTYRDRDIERVGDRYSSRDRYRDGSRDAERDRSRGYNKYDYRDDGYGGRDKHRGYDYSRHQSDRDRRYGLEKNRLPKDNSLMEDLDGVHRDDDDQKDYQERVDIELAGQEEDDAEKIKEQSRRLREAILQKYKAQKPQNENVPQNAKESSEGKEEDTLKNADMPISLEEVVQSKRCDRDSGALEASFDLGKSPSDNSAAVVNNSTGAGGLGEGTPKSERSNDMFFDDIFGESPAGVRRTGKGDGLPVERSGLHDNWDDPEGYYSFRLGEILDSRYEITAAHGKGVFSTVVRAKDLKAGDGDPEEVAIKIIRNNETMLKAGIEEVVILKKLVGADQDDRRHCVRYHSHFKYRNHLCIVFESLHMNLREVLKKFGRNIGLKLTAVRAYSKQLFIALKHLRNCGVLHCDIKPDNMLVNDAKNVLKLCDFGNAMFAGKNEVTPYLVSRFYRAPEIILGLSYDHPMDIWSVGCCLYELYTGKVLFPGPTNNDMLRLHMELKGPFPKKMLRKGAFVEKHFDSNLNFLAIEEDPVTKKPIRRPMVNIKPKDVSIIIKGSPGEDPKMLANFKDLLDKIFALDPEKRLTVSQALNHPFITGK